MTGFAATEIFEPWELDLLRRAEHVVRQLPEGLRCHEVARVVRQVLGTGVVRDGKVGDTTRGCQVDHSWVVLEDDGTGRRLHVLDCYAVGQVPPVQLVDAGFPLANPFFVGKDRDDIDHEKVRELAAGVQPLRRVYVFDNDLEYEDNEVLFIEADPALMEPFVALMQRCWPRRCMGCGAERGVVVPSCTKLPGHRAHEYRRSPYLVCSAEQVRWANNCGAMDMAAGICRLSRYVPLGVCDMAAAREMLELAAKVDPDHVLGEVGSFYEVPW